MKSILAQLADAKKDTKVFVDAMLETQQVVDEFEEYNHYPLHGTPEERLAYFDKRDSIRETAKKAQKKAKAKVIAFGQLLGMDVKFKAMSLDREIKEKFYSLVYYCEEIELRTGRVIEVYKDLNNH